MSAVVRDTALGVSELWRNVDINSSLPLDMFTLALLHSPTESSDYVGQTLNVTIPAEMSSPNFTVTIIDDAVLEEEEQFNLALSIPPFPASLGIHSAAYDTVTITDDDFLTVQFAESSYYVSEGAGEVVLNLTANGTSAVNYTVVVDTVDGSATGRHSSAVTLYSVNICKHTCCW